MCEHCKRNGYIKYKCWILYLHLKPSRFKDSKANISQKVMTELASSSNQGGELAKNVSMEYVKKSDLEDLIKAYASKLSGITFYSHKFLDKPDHKLVVDSGASHHMISNGRLLKNIEPCLRQVTITDGKDISIEGTGKLRLFHKKTNAFFVPKFKSNLVAVIRLFVALKITHKASLEQGAVSVAVLPLHIVFCVRHLSPTRCCHGEEELCCWAVMKRTWALAMRQKHFVFFALILAL